ncbi:MAG: hypothetical protein CMO29_15600, partial [Tistrella sp.]|nr:hypothetical protein [Tistrella sp.]
MAVDETGAGAADDEVVTLAADRVLDIDQLIALAAAAGGQVDGETGGLFDIAGGVAAGTAF